MNGCDESSLHSHVERTSKFSIFYSTTEYPIEVVKIIIEELVVRITPLESLFEPIPSIEILLRI